MKKRSEWAALRARIAKAAEQHTKALQTRIAASSAMQSIQEQLTEKDRALLPKRRRKFGRKKAVAEERERRGIEAAKNDNPAQRRLREQLHRMNQANRRFAQEQDEALEKLKRDYPDAKAYELLEAAGPGVDAFTFGRSAIEAVTQALATYEQSRRRKQTAKATQGKMRRGATTKERVNTESLKLLKKNPRLTRTDLKRKLTSLVSIRAKDGTERQISEDQAAALLKELNLPHPPRGKAPRK